jgi:GPH family glycoside/pentoside/hexuronide:cation symporter
MLLWIVPLRLQDIGVFIWIAGSFIFFDTMWTLTNVPYYTSTSELTDDYDERASLTAYRMVLGVPAYIVGAALTLVKIGMFVIKRAGFAAVGVIYGILVALPLLIAYPITYKKHAELRARLVTVDGATN